MNITAQLKNKELTIIVTSKQPKTMIFDITELPFFSIFEYNNEIYNIELHSNGLWIGQAGQDGVMQQYELSI